MHLPAIQPTPFPEMFAIMPPTTPPAFSFSRGQSHHQHRPTVSSPLSSSPTRGSTDMAISSPLQPHHHQQHEQQPLSPCNPNALNTLSWSQTQSSPIHPFSSFPPTFSNNSETNNSNGTSKFRFATRNPRPNPVLKRREDAQAGRRRLFLQNVRQRAEDRRWEMRGGEDELLKLEWHRLNREMQQARDAEAALYSWGLSDPGLEEEEEELQRQMRMQQGYADEDGNMDVDAMMADAIAQQEQAEVDALVSSLEGGGGGNGNGQGGVAAQFSDDDEDYDGLFMDLISQQDGLGMGHEQDVEMT